MTRKKELQFTILEDGTVTNLSEVREQCGVSQSELARRIGKTPSYVCDLERSRRDGMYTATLANIAKGLGIKKVEFFFD